MIDREYCRTLAAYNRWMNERIYTLCANLADEERRRDLGAFFRSIDGTLNHLLWGDLIWLSRFTGRPAPTTRIDEPIHADFDSLRSAREGLDREILEWAETIDAEWLAAPFTWTASTDGSGHTQPAWLLVTHFFQHQTHHRGQVTTLLMQLGHDPGVTDLPYMPATPAS